MRLFIANIPHQLSEAELNQLLTQYGQIISLKLTVDQDGKRKGYGFAEMHDRSQAQKAIDGLDSFEVKGRQISVKESNEHPSSELRVKRQRIAEKAESSNM